MQYEMHLFAVVTNGIKQISLSGSLQQELKEIFSNSYSEYTKEREYIPFDPGYKPDKTELFQYENFEIEGTPIELASNSLSVESLAREDINLETIKAIFGAYYDDNGNLETAIFKVMDKTKIIGNEKSILFNKNTFVKLEEKGLIIPENIDAIFENGNLLFHSYVRANKALDMASIFKEASATDVYYFLKIGPFNEEDKDKIENIADSWCRRKISMIRNRNILDRISLEDICQHASNHDIVINTDDDNIIEIPQTRKEFKELLRVLDDDYLKSDLTEERYMTNSKRNLSSN